MLLCLAPEAPVPPLTGGRERTRRVLARLAARWPVHLLACADDAEAALLRELARDLGLAGLSILPYPPLRRGYAALAALVARLAAAQSAPFAGLHCVGLDLWPAALRARLAPGARRVLELHDAPLAASGATLKALNRADAVIAVAAGDAERLRARGVRAPIHVVPNGVDPAQWAGLPPAPDAPMLLFPAAFNWPPNAQAARVLVRQVLPRVRALVPSATLTLAGRRPGRDLLALAAAEPAVTLVADPPDMRPLFAQAALVVVPTAAQGGTRLKILQALAAGRPVVSTPAGAAGLGLRPGQHLLVAPLVEPFANACAHLLNHAAARAALAEAGRIAAQAHAWEHALAALDGVWTSSS
jgi:glycosyltransferase involved in cell wall biosynthesis